MAQADSGSAQRCRTLLFVPANHPGRVARALNSRADGAVIDLEDAVAARSKDAARAQLAHLPAAESRAQVFVRVNAPVDELAKDLESLRPSFGRLSGLLLPKAESAAAVRLLVDSLAGLSPAEKGFRGPAIIPVIETAKGVLNATEIASASPSVRQLLFGPADLAAELGITPTAEGQEFWHARAHIVLVSAAAGLPGPLDGPHLRLDDAEGLAVSARAARQLGFSGKCVIHPQQIDLVNDIFGTSAAELAWAHDVVSAFDAAAASGQGVARTPDGTFVDAPVAARARQLIERYADPDEQAGTS
jgi:citrate lyase subunit beta / citryl-CoA lyase